MTTPNHRWYHLTPTRFFIGLLAVQVLLFLSERFQWFPFNEKKGWTVLIAMGVVVVAVVVMLVWGLVCLVLRRRFQFNFRSLLVFVLAVSVPLGWFAWEIQRARNQGEAVERIRELGGFESYECPNSEEVGWMEQLLGGDFFFDVEGVICNSRNFGDHDARHFQELPNLKRLCLDHTQITDEGVVHLEGLTKLEGLSLIHTSISDEGLAHLDGMTELRELYLDGTRITDKGPARLKRMTKLNGLWLGDTKVTNGGVSQLELALPNCDISTTPYASPG